MCICINIHTYMCMHLYKGNITNLFIFIILSEYIDICMHIYILYMCTDLHKLNFDNVFPKSFIK